MRRHLRCGALLVLLTAAGGAAQEAAPALPALALDRFPEAARRPVARAYEAARAAPADAALAGALARLLHAWEQWEAAHQAYARARALAPKALEWRYLDAVVLQRMARHEEAAARFEEAVALDPDFLPARVKLPDALYEAGRVEQSRPLFEALVRDPRTAPMGHYGLGRSAAAEGRHDAAVRELERAVGLFPEWGAAHYALALSYRALGRRDEAQRALERHARFGPRWPAPEDPLLAEVAALREDARALVQRGVALAERGDLAGAIAAHEAALVRDPAFTRAHVNLVSLYGRQERWGKAETHYRAALKLGGDLGDVHYDYGVLQWRQGQLEAAAAAYGRALAADPRHARAHNNLGELLERQGRLEEALASYRRAVASEPDFRLARLNAGRMLLGLQRAEEAVEELRPIVEPRDAESPRYLFALAVALVRAGRVADGAALAKEAKALALDYGQTDLAAAIDRDLARLK